MIPYYYPANIKWQMMKKKIRRFGKSSIIVEKWSRDNYQLPVIPDWVYSRHLRRRTIYRYKDGTSVIAIENGWYVHISPIGVRLLSVLPF